MMIYLKKYIPSLINIFAFILLLFCYIPNIFQSGSIFLKSNLVFTYYLITESFYNGLIFFMVFSFIKEDFTKKDILLSLSFGLIVNYLSVFHLSHNFLLNNGLFPNFLAVGSNNEPSEQYLRLYVMLFVVIFTSVGNIFLIKKLKLIFLSIFTISYFIFFTLTHHFVLDLYHKQKELETARIEVILKNYDSLTSLCTKYGYQCLSITDGQTISYNLPIRESLFKNFKNKNEVNAYLNNELKDFKLSENDLLINLDTSLVKESIKYGFYKTNNGVIYLIDSSHLTRGSDFYVILFNTIQLIYVLVWVFGGWFIYNLHNRRFIEDKRSQDNHSA